MIARACGIAAGLIAALLGSILYADYSYPPQKRDGMEARLTVTAAGRIREAGRGEVTLTLTVTGPSTLEVEEPHLSDTTASWKEERLTSTRVVENDKKQATWSQVIRLKQAKPGMELPPDVSVRFRNGPDGTWEKAEWIDIFKQIRDVPSPPEPPTPSPSWLRRWWFSVLLLAMGILLLAWMAKRRRNWQTATLPPEQYALRELARIEQTLLSPQGDAEVFHTQLSQVVRRYLAERFGLHALEQTTAEFLDTIRQIPQLPASQQERLRDLFERCDLAKFARASTPPEECRRTAEMARELVRETSSSPARSTSKGLLG